MRIGMRVLKLNILLMILILVCVSCADKEDKTEDIPVLDGKKVAVRAEVDAASKYIGQEFELALTLHYLSDVEVAWPEIGDELGEFKVSESVLGPSKKLEDGTMLSRKLWLIYVDEPGTFTIPAIEIEYLSAGDTPGRISTDPIDVEVLSNLAASEQPGELRDIKGPSFIPKRYGRLYSLIGVVVVILGAIGAVIYFVARRQAIPKLLPTVPPEDEAMERLLRIKGRNLVGEGRFKQYFIEVSGVVRHYIERMFGVTAPEMTTEEFLIHTASENVLKTEWRELLEEFLTSSDMVKFARYRPTENECEQVFDTAVRFVKESSREKQVEEDATKVQNNNR
jgi:hypothetical protein